MTADLECERCGGTGLDPDRYTKDEQGRYWSEPCADCGADDRTAARCPAAHPADSTPCGGPVVVMVLDADNAGARGCEQHAARLLASLAGGRVYGLPNAPMGTAIRVYRAAGGIAPFEWMDAERSRVSAVSRSKPAVRH